MNSISAGEWVNDGHRSVAELLGGQEVGRDELFMLCTHADPLTSCKADQSDWNPHLVSRFTACQMLSEHRHSFLPKVQDLEKDDGLQKQRDELTARLHVPRFFWTKLAWESNGFFELRDDIIPGFEGENHCEVLSVASQ